MRVDDSTGRTAPTNGHDLLEAGRLADLLHAEPPAGGTHALPPGRGVAFDSRRVRTGDVFFALPGASGHGGEHAGEALDKGAAYVVSDRTVAPESEQAARTMLVADAPAALRALGLAARERLRCPVVAVTGSAGKTTTKTMVTAALAGRSTPGNLNTVPALVAALVEAALMDAADPEATGADVNRGALVGPGGPGSPVVLELGIDRPGEMADLLAFCRPEHGLVTTIGESHLSALGDVASVAREKSLLLAEAPGARLATPGAAALLPPAVAARTRVVEVELSAAGALRHDGRDFVLPWPGRAMAENAALALSLASIFGVDAELAFARLSAARLEPGRLQHREVGGLHLIDDSYNSNPLSAALALEVLAAAAGPKVAILGDMRELGEVSRQRHRELGAATRGLDLVIAVGDEAAAIAETNPAAVTVPDAAAAIDLLELIPAGATVLVKGSRSLGLERVVAAFEERR